jgi:outer membrane protein OmpA-like peptidoglycan-associated protein
VVLGLRVRGGTCDLELGGPIGSSEPLLREVQWALGHAAGEPGFLGRLRVLLAETGGVHLLGRHGEVGAAVEQIRLGRLGVRLLEPMRLGFGVGPEVTELGHLAGEEPLPPAPPRDEQSTHFEVAVVDELSVPLAGIPVAFEHEGRSHAATTGADGVARIDVEGVSFATAILHDREAIAAEVGPRWRGIRPGERLTEESPDVSVRHLDDASPLSVSLLAKTRHTISIQPDVRLARLLGLHFDTGSSFLLPTAIPNIRAVAELYSSMPGAAVLAVGHAAAEGERDFADELAVQRAESVAAYLRDDVDTWMTRYDLFGDTTRRWGSAEDKLMLSSLPDYPSKPVGEHAVRWYQRTRGLTVDSQAGPETRRQLITEYMAHDGTTLPQGVTLEAHGVGAAFPAPEAPGGEQGAFDGFTDQEHRRVELLLFEGRFGVLPAPAAVTSRASDPQYPEWIRRARQIVELSAEGSTKLVTMLEMQDVLFRTNSCVVLPEGEDPSPGPEHPSLRTVGSIATVLRYAEERPGKKVLVAGHCDTTGTVAFNQTLSEERAAVVLSLLLGQRDEFRARCHARHAVADYKQILSWVADALGFDCDPGGIDDVAFTGIEPVRRFQRGYNARKAELGASGPDLATDGAMGPMTWGAFFDCYEHLLRVELGEDALGVSELRGGLVFVDPERKALGFSEHFPIDELGRANFRSQANRRVEILLFDDGEEPNLDLGGGAPEYSEVYLPGRYERVPLDARLSANTIAVRLCRPDGEPTPDAPYTITLARDIATGVTDADGWLLVHLEDTTASMIIDWDDPAGEDPELSRYSRTVRLDVDETDADGDHGRLANLNYAAPTLDEQLAAYRAEWGRPSAVSDAALLAEARGWHDGGPRPAAAVEASQ